MGLMLYILVTLGCFLTLGAILLIAKYFNPLIEDHPRTTLREALNNGTILLIFIVSLIPLLQFLVLVLLVVFLMVLIFLAIGGWYESNDKLKKFLNGNIFHKEGK